MLIKEGTYILIIDNKNTKKIEKVEHRRFISASGYIELNKLIGKQIPLKTKTNKGNEILILEPSLSDFINLKYTRGPQTISQKDIAQIILKLDITKDHKILEAGSGSGFLTTYLALNGKKLITFEKEKRFFEIVSRNLSLLNEFLNQKNIKTDIELKNLPVEKCTEENFDAIFFDFLNSYEYTDFMYRKLKYGGRGGFYLTNMKQVLNTIQNLRNTGFREIEMMEIIQRKYDTDKYRPIFNQLVHTAYMIFVRKI